MRAITLLQALLGLALRTAIPVVGRGMALIVTALQVVGGMGVLAAALGATRTS